MVRSSSPLPAAAGTLTGRSRGRLGRAGVEVVLFRNILILSFLYALILPGHAGGAGRIFLSDPVPDYRLHHSPAEMVTEWHRNGLKDVTLLHLSTASGFLNSPGAPRSVERLRALLENRRFEEVHRLGTPLPFRENLVTGDNFIQAANLLGMIGETVWVLPRGRSLTEKNFEDLKKLYTPEAGTESPGSLRFSRGVIEGTLGGMPVRICTLSDLENIELNRVVLHVDMKFFPALNANSRGRSPLGTLFDTMENLRTRRLDVQSVHLSDVFYGGLTPLYHAFLLDALKTLISEPSLLQQPVDPRWAAVAEALEMERVGERDGALNIMQHLAERYPRYAYPYYFAATVFCRRGDQGPCLDFLGRAFEKDARYIDGFIELSVLASKGGRKDFARHLLEEAARLDEDNYLVLYMLGNTAISDGRCEEAALHYRRFTGVLGEFGEITDLIETCGRDPAK